MYKKTAQSSNLTATEEKLAGKEVISELYGPTVKHRSEVPTSIALGQTPGYTNRI